MPSGLLPGVGAGVFALTRTLLRGQERLDINLHRLYPSYFTVSNIDASKYALREAECAIRAGSRRPGRADGQGADGTESRRGRIKSKRRNARIHSHNDTPHHPNQSTAGDQGPSCEDSLTKWPVKQPRGWELAALEVIVRGLAHTSTPTTNRTSQQKETKDHRARISSQSGRSSSPEERSRPCRGPSCEDSLTQRPAGQTREGDSTREKVIVRGSTHTVTGKAVQRKESDREDGHCARNSSHNGAGNHEIS